MGSRVSNVIDRLFNNNQGIDWILFASTLALVGAGLVTMNSFSGENYFFERQILWVGLSVALFFGLSFVDFRFLRRTWIIITLFLISCVVLLFLFILGDVIKGAQNRFDLGIFSFQPSDPVKLVLILLLAKYFSRRHVEIAHVKHILVSGFYTFILFILVFLQPDFGSAIIIALIWVGIVLVAGISKKHLAIIALLGIVMSAGLWFYALEDYQKQRIVTYIHPLTDLQGAGYNAYQSTVAVGSGEFFGKGIGFGTQSRLQFLPEYETDFIFAAFAEEWGFLGVFLLFILFGIVLWRVLANALYGASNFEMLFGIGLAIFIMSHFIIHVGMNVGLLPVTGTTLPFVSYGGSHLITEFVGLGILMGMRRYRRIVHRDDMENELPGIT
ncbi:rod shape-determining protein RodA [Patescibacteria group bacterium]|nr:rod shape-determining protein RodA [Patescibacteria group bacterium]